jgi:hypothetical protein
MNSCGPLLWCAAALALPSLALPSLAAAEELPPIVIAPFRNRCFDAAGLAERVLSQLPDAVVLVGAPPPGAHQLVRVSGEDRQLTVQLSLRNQRHRVIGSDERLLPLGDDCAAAAETAALMVVRAATPLVFRSPPPPKRPPRPPGPQPSENRTPAAENPPKPSESRTTPPPPPSAVSESRTAPNAPAPPPSGNRTTAENPPPLPSGSRTKTEPPPSESRTTVQIPRHHRRLEVDVAALWSFPLDGPPSTPAADVTIGWRWRMGRRLQLGVGLRAGVAGEWSATTVSPQGPISLSARRIPLGVELRLDVEVPLGVVRISLGPEAAVWVASSTGLPRPGSAVFAQPGAFVRAAYRFELGPVVLSAGLVLDAVFLRDNLTVGGVGTVAQTPVVLVSPFVSAGIGFY